MRFLASFLFLLTVFGATFNPVFGSDNDRRPWTNELLISGSRNLFLVRRFDEATGGPARPFLVAQVDGEFDFRFGFQGFLDLKAATGLDGIDILDIQESSDGGYLLLITHTKQELQAVGEDLDPAFEDLDLDTPQLEGDEILSLLKLNDRGLPVKDFGIEGLIEIRESDPKEEFSTGIFRKADESVFVAYLRETSIEEGPQWIEVVRVPEDGGRLELAVSFKLHNPDGLASSLENLQIQEGEIEILVSGIVWSEGRFWFQRISSEPGSDRADIVESWPVASFGDAIDLGFLMDSQANRVFAFETNDEGLRIGSASSRGEVLEWFDFSGDELDGIHGVRSAPFDDLRGGGLELLGSTEDGDMLRILGADNLSSIRVERFSSLVSDDSKAQFCRKQILIMIEIAAP